MTLAAGSTAAFVASLMNNGTIAGSGAINGNISGSGTVSPGLSTGILTVNGAFADSGPLAIELNGPAVGTQYDQLKVNGTVTLSGPLTVTLGYAPAIGTSFRIIDNDGSDPINGTFNGLLEGATFTVNGAIFQISYIGGTGNDVVVTRFNPNAPHVAQVIVGDGAAQRSSVNQLKVVFDRIISYTDSPEKAFKLQKIVGGLPVGNVGILVTTVTVGNHSEVTLTFTSDTTFGSLNDGRYRLNVIGERIVSNGAPMESDYVLNFHRMYGDTNGDARIDIADFGLFSTTYGKQVGDPGYFGYFDFNGDGRIDAADFGQFSVRMFTKLP
jgi:hypothetical protein